MLFLNGQSIRNSLGIDGGVDICSGSYQGAEMAGIILSLATGEGEAAIGERVAQRVLTNEGTLRTSQTVANQLAGSRSFIPVQSILDAIASGDRVADAQGVANQFMYTAEAAYNGSVGTLEVLVNEATNTINHVLYRSL
jgi:hypothetical protein